MAFGCLVHSASPSLAAALSGGIRACICPCFHHFLLFSAKQKWDCPHFWGFLQLLWVCHTCWVSAEGNCCAWHGGHGRASRSIPICSRVRRFCVWDLRLLSGCPAGRGVRGVWVQAWRGWKTLVVIEVVCSCCLWGYKLWWAKGDRTEILPNLRAWFFPFPLLPQNSQPELFDMRSYWYSYLLTLIFMFLQNYDALCSWFCRYKCIRYPRGLRFTIKKYFCRGISEPVRWGCLCVYMWKRCVFCLLPDILVAIVQWSICEHPEDHCYS